MAIWSVEFSAQEQPALIMADTLNNQATAGSASNTAAQQLFQQACTSNIDAQATQQLTNLAQIRQARINQLQRQVAPLIAQKGAADTQVVSLQKSIQSQQSLVSALAVVRAKASTPAPTVSANGWVIYGYVRDQNLQPAARLTVTLTNQQKVWQHQYGYSFTDANGYFSLDYTPPAAAPSPTPAPTAPTPAPTVGTTTAPAIALTAATFATAPVATFSTTPAVTPAATISPTVAAVANINLPAAPLSLYVQVLNAAGQPVYIDSQAFTPAPGTALYKDIVLAGTVALGTPPPGAAVVLGSPL